MAVLTTYAANKILDHALGTAAWTMPAQMYLALCTTAPTAAAAGAAVSASGTGYARQAVDFTAAAAVSGGASGATSNAATVTFPTATASWGTVTHWELYDAVTGGNRIAYGAWTIAKTISTADVFTVPAGDLDITAG